MESGNTPAVGAPSVNLSALGALKLQNAFGSGVEIDTHGNVTVNATLKAKEYEVDTDNTSPSFGSGTLPRGQTRVVIYTESTELDSAVFVTPETLITLPLTVTDKDPGASFTVELATPQTKDVSFKWWVIN